MDVNYRDKYNQYVGGRNAIQKRYNETVKLVDQATTNYNDALVAQAILQKAAKDTQEPLKYSIEEIVTTGVYSVFGDEGYDFVVTFETKNNRTSCILEFVDKSRESFDAEDDLGGSLGDIASFACRISLWTLMGENKTMPIFLLDECMKHLSERWRSGGGELLKAFCDKLGMQIIISTHLTELIGECDNSIQVSKRGGVSHVRIEN